MPQIIATAILMLATLASFSLALALTRLGITVMFRILPARRLPLRVISGGRARAHAAAGLS